VSKALAGAAMRDMVIRVEAIGFIDALQGVETDVVGLIPWLTRRGRNKFVISHARDDL